MRKPTAPPSQIVDHYPQKDDFLSDLKQAEANASTPWEDQFVEDTRERYNRFGMTSFMSEAQVAVFHRLANKHHR